ncbi:DUF1801 domain-containing protein [Pseudoalteromonas sp. MMG013]|uniref:DUF1801 domain-containing protein n=1 Tax=Pseudoalteromonas sp. MMG013 TaxID=2822687 RepID=UPI001B38FC5C|nr:DUF1801 domain-containing protein [Pseudoalteromonas sp. MMG013]MBQ4864166.1 DUF1801 domain-containing protein [Pseudoalteromonas sp. MMG013]
MKKVIADKFNAYPDDICLKLTYLRRLIVNTATELSAGVLEETLKWGEPSFKVKSGTAIRLDWKNTSPDSYFLFFNCNTKLVDTFRQLYPNELQYQGNRAIVLNRSQAIPEQAITHCIKLALTYHKIKHLPLLGA